MHVVVAGAGPVGTVAAYSLARAGIRTTLLEAEASCREDMRASTMHPPTLDMLDQLGVLDTLEAQGLRAPVYHYRNRRTNDVLAFDLSELAGELAHPYRLQCEQFKITRLLTGLTAGLDAGDVRFSRRVTGLVQTEAGVTLEVVAPVGTETIVADYVIAADGASSAIRKILGIPFEGFTYPERFLTFSTAHAMDTALEGLADVNYIADPDEWCVLLRIPGLWRVLVPTANTDTDAELLSDAHKRQVFARLIGDGQAASLETTHRTVYRIHQRVAVTYRAGRVLLAGDAAHINNPLGGFGMNSGIHDAWSLCDRLIRIRDGASADALLDQYDRQRRTVMHEFVQAQTIQNKAALEAGSAEAQLQRESALRAILADDGRRRDYLLTQAMVRSLERAAAIV